MKENKDIHPVDKLFKQALEGYRPIPPKSVLKDIRSKKIGKNLSSGKWFTRPGGLTVITGVVLVVASWFIYKAFLAEPGLSQKDAAVPNVIIDPDSKQSVPEDSIFSNHPVHDPSAVETSPSVDLKNENKPSIITTVESAAKTGNPANHNSVTKQKHTKTANAGPFDQDGSKTALSQVAAPVTDKQSGRKSTSANHVFEKIPEVNSFENNIKLAVVVGLKADSNTFHSTLADTISDRHIEQVQIAVEKGEKASGGVSSVSAEVPDIKKTGTLNGNSDLPEITKSNLHVGGNDTSGSDGKSGHMLPENLVWQASIYGYYGQVYQKYRKANLFYSGMITGGLWSNKLKGGIETGIELSKYKDYGKVENSWILTDTTFKYDTIWHQVDSILIPEIIITPVVNHNSYTGTVDYKYTYTYLQVPLFFTKQVFTKSRYSLDVKGGPSVGFMISGRKSVTGPKPPDNVIFSSLSENYSRLHVTCQFTIAPQFRWDITQRLSLAVCPSAVLYLNNLYDKKNRPYAKPYSISVYGGLIYKIQ